MMRLCVTLAGLGFAFSILAMANDDKKPAAATLDLFGSVDDETLATAAPKSGVITSQKSWEKLADTWGSKGTAKVDFAKELIVVATTRGSRLRLNVKVDAQGDLKVLGLATRDLRPGFRYAIKTVSRKGVKTVHGKPLPKE